MKLRYVIAIVAIVAGLGGAFVYVRSNPDLWIRVLDADRVREGEQAIARIQAYQMREKSLPNSLEDVGVSSDGPIYYRKLDASRYVVWFSYALGESYSYDSRTAAWGAREVVVDEDAHEGAVRQ